MRNFTILTLLILALYSCQDKKNANQILVDSGFSDYVNAFTSGVIGSKSTIKIVLTQPQAGITPGEILKDEFETIKLILVIIKKSLSVSSD